MSLWSRLANVFRGDRLSGEIDEEFRSHIQEGIEQGRDPAEVRKAFGSALRQRDESQDARAIAWLDALRADAVFGWRQLMKKKVTSAAAILSLALAINSGLLSECLARLAGHDEDSPHLRQRLPRERHLPRRSACQRSLREG